MNSYFLILTVYFKVNGVEKSLPFSFEYFNVYRYDHYIVFDDNKFQLYFNGFDLMKLRVCEKEWIGLCRIDNQHYEHYPYASLFADPHCSVQVK